ncbi:MAG TPA: hypothetical protein VNB06_20765, partial [Thermoanaerobaculia bacterium]|nr:hypothetical protein [Thermoanaerobaculia bacterium]
MRKGEQSSRGEGRRIRSFGGAVPAWPLLRGTLIRFLPAALLGLVAVYLVQDRHREEAFTHLRQEGRRVVEAQSNLMRSAFAEVALDIGRVLQDRDVRGFALDHSSATDDFLSLELLNLALWRDSYDLVQVFDADGVEVVAVEREPGAATPAIVARLDGNTSSDPLTDATFQEAARLEAGGLLVSLVGLDPTPSAAS